MNRPFLTRVLGPHAAEEHRKQMVRNCLRDGPSGYPPAIVAEALKHAPHRLAGWELAEHAALRRRA